MRRPRTEARHRRQDRSSRGLTTEGPLQKRFLSAHDQISNLFHLRRDHVTAVQHRAARVRAFEAWAEVSGIVALAA